MFASVLSMLTGLVEKRFQLQALLPALAFVLATGLVVIGGGPGFGSTIDTWEAQDGLVQVSEVIIAITVIFVLAMFLSSQTLSIIRLFEGYTFPLKHYQPGVEWHRTRYGRLDDDSVRATEYPIVTPETSPRPTRLGNILLSGELYPYDRYGADSVLVWPRLYGLLPTDAVDRLASARSQMELCLTLCVLSAVWGAFAGTFLAWSAVPFVWVVLCFGGSFVISMLLYQAALGFALAYSGQVRATFDLYRLKLFDGLHIPMPQNRSEERRRWDDVNYFMFRNDPRVTWPYTTATAGEGATSAKPESTE